MQDKNKGALAPTLLTLGVLAGLLFRFGRYIQSNSYDLLQHFLLADELMKHAQVMPGDIWQMAIYPPGAHWLAAIVGWIGGTSGLVGITLVTIASIYFSYVLILRLVGADSPVRIALLAAAFFALQGARSLVGWEVVLNYFYSQLVNDVLYFGMLLWLANSRGVWRKVGALLFVGWFGMWIHAMAPLHLLAAGCVLLSFQTLMDLKGRRSATRAAMGLLVLLIGAAVTVSCNRAFADMREIAENNGWLTFGYPHVLLVALLCVVPGVWNLYRQWRGRGEYVDAVLGCALVASVSLMFMQYAVLRLHADGSAYAVKKHMFIIMTLAVMNAVRAVAPLLPAPKWQLREGLVAPLAAGLASFVVLQSFTTSVAPIVRALSYADNAVRYNLPNFKPGDFVADVDTLPLIANVTISMASFRHPFDARARSWPLGTAIKEGAKFVMVRNTPDIDHVCPQRLAETSEYAIIDPACLRIYHLGDVLTFSTGGNAWNYASTGWAGPESWGSWALGNGAALNMTIAEPVNGTLTLTADGMVYASAKHPSQRIDIEINGTDIGSWTYTRDAPIGQRTIEIPESIARSGKLRIVFKAVNAVSPLQMGDSADGRVLGLGVKTVTLKAN